MVIHIITSFVDYNYCLKRLYTKLHEPTNQNLVKFPKVVEPTNGKRYNKTLGTSVINSPMSSPSLGFTSIYAF